MSRSRAHSARHSVPESRTVLAEQPIESSLDVVRIKTVGGIDVSQRDDERRSANDAVPSIDVLSQLGQCLQVVTGARLLDDVLGAPCGPQLALSCRRTTDEVHNIMSRRL